MLSCVPAQLCHERYLKTNITLPHFSVTYWKLQKNFFDFQIIIDVDGVVDPHWFQSGSGSSFYLNGDPDPGSQTNPNPDLGQTFKVSKSWILTRKIYSKQVISQQTTHEGTKASERQETRFFCLFWSVSMLPDPDPHSSSDPDPEQPIQCGFGSTTLDGDHFCFTYYLFHAFLPLQAWDDTRLRAAVWITNGPTHCGLAQDTRLAHFTTKKL